MAPPAPSSAVRTGGNVSRQTRLKRRCGGFTLVELGIVVAVLLVLAVGVGYFFGVGGQSRNAALLAFQRTLGDAALRMNANTNCIPRQVRGLFDNAANQAANTFCGIEVPVGTWKQPYMQPTDFNAGGDAVVNNIMSGVVVSIQREAGGIGQRYFTRSAGVPNAQILEMLQECNGNNDTTVGFDRFRCRGAPGGGAAATGTFDMLFHSAQG